MALKVLAVIFGFVLAPAFITAAETDLYGAFGRQIVGNPCAIRVYNTDFNFPDGGGRIVMYGPEMYFIRTSQPGCDRTGLAYPTVAASNSSYNPVQTWNNGTPYVNPAFVSNTSSFNYAPATNASNYQYTTVAGTQPIASFYQQQQARTTCY